MKSILDADFKYTPSKDHGPDYMKNKMDLYRNIEEERARAKAAKVCGKIEPKQVRSK